MPNNIWTYDVADKDGNVLKRRLRGPINKKDVIRLAQQVNDAQRNHAVRSGADDPELRVLPETVKPVGEDNRDLGFWQPRGVRPIDIDAYAKKDERGEPINLAETTPLGQPVRTLAGPLPGTAIGESPAPAETVSDGPTGEK